MSRLIGSLPTALTVALLVGGLVPWVFPLTAPAGAPPTVDAAGLGPAERIALEFPPNPGKVYKVGGDVKAPVPIHIPDPVYPLAASKAKAQGTVILWAVVDASGNVADVGVKKSLRPDMDLNAKNAVRTWKFKPATRKGKPVAVRLTIEITFRVFPNRQ